MTDVFLSYSSRDGIDAWVKNFAEDITAQYRVTYHDELFIWYYSKPDASSAADNFREIIDTVINNCLIMMPILDYQYMQSGETIKELDDYKKKKNTAIPCKYIKVIAYQSPDTNVVVTNSLIRTVLCDENDALLGSQTAAYQAAVAKIVRAIYLEKKQYDIDRSLKYIRSLDKEQLKIYTALGSNKLLNASRDTVVRQLIGTLRRETFMAGKTCYPLPDQLLIAGTDEHFSYESMTAMIHKEEELATALIKEMITTSDLIIVPVEFDDVDVIRVYTESLQQQLKLIIAEANNRPQLQVYFLLNVPESMYQTPAFADAFDSIPLNALKNLTIIRNQDITSFIELISGDIKKASASLVPAENSRNIYVLETYLSSFANERELTESEKKNRREFRRTIIDNRYTIIPFLATGTLSDAVIQHSDNLKNSNKVIIYKGVKEEPSWWLLQQSEIYKALSTLKKDFIARAIYIDPDEEEREKESYEFYSYRVLLQNPGELTEFLNLAN